MSKYSVYKLADPNDGAVRYVGISKDVEQRYYYHCNASDPTSNAWTWLIKLKKQKVKPLLFVVEEVDSWNMAYERETYWLNFLLDEGEPLLNYVAPARRRNKGVA